MIRLPERLVQRLLVIGLRREPDESVGGVEDTYMRRWFLLPKNPVCNVYLHHFMRSDDDRALHDHPWPSLSFMLRGEMVEWTFAKVGNRWFPEPRRGLWLLWRPLRAASTDQFYQREIREGDITFRSASLAHRIELRKGHAWTLFITGPKLREWGFHCPRGWRHWRDFTKPGPGGAGSEVGRGCT